MPVVAVGLTSVLARGEAGSCPGFWMRLSCKRSSRRRTERSARFARLHALPRLNIVADCAAQCAASIRPRAGLRRLRSSFNIPTFPGRNARTVSGFNRRSASDVTWPTLLPMRSLPPRLSCARYAKRNVEGTTCGPCQTPRRQSAATAVAGLIIGKNAPMSSAKYRIPRGFHTHCGRRAHRPEAWRMGVFGP